MEFKYDTQLLLEGENLGEDVIHDYIQDNIPGDCLLVAGGDDLIKLHFHTNVPWRVLEYCATLGDVYDVVVENMEGASGVKKRGPSAGVILGCGVRGIIKFGLRIL